MFFLLLLKKFLLNFSKYSTKYSKLRILNLFLIPFNVFEKQHFSATTNFDLLKEQRLIFCAFSRNYDAEACFTNFTSLFFFLPFHERFCFSLLYFYVDIYMDLFYSKYLQFTLWLIHEYTFLFSSKIIEYQIQ